MSTAIYKSGLVIELKDHVIYDGSEGVIELIITADDDDWDSYWHKHGEGIMIKCPKYGRVYVPFDDEELDFALAD